MHYIAQDKPPQEHVQYIDESHYQIIQTFCNVAQAHSIEFLKTGDTYTVNLIFSPSEKYEIGVFDCEKAAKAYVNLLLEYQAL